jgi:hypothetical protein
MKGAVNSLHIFPFDTAWICPHERSKHVANWRPSAAIPRINNLSCASTDLLLTNYCPGILCWAQGFDCTGNKDECTSEPCVWECACVRVRWHKLRTMARYNEDDENRQGATRLLLLAAVAVCTVHRLLLSFEISKPLWALAAHWNTASAPSHSITELRWIALLELVKPFTLTETQVRTRQRAKAQMICT